MNFKGLGRIPPATCKYNIDTAEVYTGTCTVCTCSFNAFLQFFYVVVAYSLQLEYKSNILTGSLILRSSVVYTLCERSEYYYDCRWKSKKMRGGLGMRLNMLEAIC